MIYDYLFYKGYQLGKRSRNFQEMPLMAGVIWVSLCIMFNIFSVMMLIQTIFLRQGYIFSEQYNYVFSIGLLMMIIFYYLYKGRYRSIIERFIIKEAKSGKGLHPLIVIFIYYVSSFVLLLVTAMFKNGDGIFSV